MSFSDGMSAINLEMPDRVPRTEYSAHQHWDLVQSVTGTPVNSVSDKTLQQKTSSEFIRQWNYDFFWNTLTHNEIFNGKYTKMGHAKYAADGVDFADNSHQLFEDPEDVFCFDLFEEFGVREQTTLTSEYNANYLQLCERNPDSVNMTGIYVTCMSGLIDLLGWDTLLCAAGIDEKAFGDFTNRYCNWIQQYFDALARSEAKVVMIHDDIVWTSGAFLNPEFYRTYIFPNYKKLFLPLQDAGKKIIYTSDGNYTEFVDDIADCGINGFVMEPCTDMKYIADKYGRTHCFIGNADTRILLQGSKEDIEAEVKRCMDIGKKYPGFFMAVGNHIPANTPVENALYYNEIYEKLSRR